jgi:hypothetical protein
MKAADDAAAETFCREVWSATVTKSARVILDAALGDVKGNGALIDAVCAGFPTVGRTTINITPRLPIVAVGGPVKVYYGEVGQRLGSKVVFAPFCEVANAIGAASALVADRVTITIEGDGSGLFRLHGGGRSESFSSGQQALTQAQALAEMLALDHAISRGAHNPKVSVAISKSHLPDAKDDEGLLTATVTAEAIGAPA